MANVSSSNSLEENVPKLRFPEFEGEWEEHKISDFLSESKIIGHNGKEAKKLTIKLWAKGVVEKKTIFDGSIQTQYYIRKSGQLVYGKLDFLNCAFGIVPPELDGYETTSDAPAFDILNINSQFLLNRIIQPSFYKKNGEKANGSRKAKRIHPDTFLAMPIFVPPILEQEKIATFIMLLDKKIELQKELIEFLKLYKRGVLGAIYEQKIRFKDESGLQYPDWSKTTIGKLFNERNERTIGGENLLAVTINNGVQKKENIDGKDISSDDKSNYKRVLINDIAYNTMRMWQGASGISQYCGIVSPAYTVITPNDTLLVDSNFYAYYFKLPSMVNTFEKYSQGLTSDTWNLKYQQLSHIPIYLPCLEEQRRAVSFLASFDICIKKADNKFNQMINIKKYLLQREFEIFSVNSVLL